MVIILYIETTTKVKLTQVKKLNISYFDMAFIIMGSKNDDIFKTQNTFRAWAKW